MSRASTSLELSEFFNNEDSQGTTRLAEYLLKRRGGVQRQNCLFVNCEPQRLSLSVQLEKLPNLQKETSSKIVENELIDKCGVKFKEQNKQQCTSDETSSELIARANVEESEGLSEPRSPCEPVLSISSFRAQNPVSPISRNQPSSSNILSPRRLTPPFSSVHKSGGGVSSSDRLRRYSFRRLTKLCGGRRTLLQEFDSTVTDTHFQPPICSTPLSQPHQDKQPPVISSQPLEAENFNPNSPESPRINESHSSHTDILIKTLRQKDEELKVYMESLLDKTLKQIQYQEKTLNKGTVDKSNTALQDRESHLKRTYTVEKGNIPGQVILTPDKCLTDRNLQSSPCNLLKTQERNICPQNGDPSQRVNKSTHQQHETTVLSNLKTVALDAQKSPQQRNVSIAFPSQSINIPETQNLPIVGESSIIIRTGIQEASMVVIPVNQTVNMTCGEELQNSIRVQPRTIQDKNSPPKLSVQLAQRKAETSKVQSYQPAEQENLKVADILTEDEGETAISDASPTVDNNSQAPLNLAARITDLGKKILRKRTLQQMVNSKLHNTDTEVSNRSIEKRYHIPLNKAPGFPLNGEQFAEELARMSNYEILDLRKRNSMGRVFAISGRKSRRSQEEVTKKQHQLGHQIEQELHKRNLDGRVETQPAYSDDANDEDEDIGEYLPVPDEFRDSMSKQQKIRNHRESSLIDERSADRVSFRNKINRRPARAKKKSMPEVLKQYLEISQIVAQKKSNNSLRRPKRSLYTQRLDESEEVVHSSPGIKKGGIHHIPSPPKYDGDLFTTLKVVSPPPTLSITLRKSATHAHQQLTNHVAENLHDTTTHIDENVVLPHPPPGFENDSGVGSNNFVNHSTLLADKTAPNSTANLNTNHNADNDDEQIFKKPDKPAPKRTRSKRNANKNSPNVLQHCTADIEEVANNCGDSTNNTLRRSKRGQVPVKFSLFQQLFQQSLDRRMQSYERKKQKQREISKADSENNESKSNSPIYSTKATKRGKMKKQLSTISENDLPSATLRQDAEIVNNSNKARKIKESKVISKQKKTDEKSIIPDENVDCSNLILSTPPPVDHLNNVFDQLRNTSCTPNTTSEIAPAPPLKLKSVRVRVARLKSLTPPTDNFDSVSTISSDINKHSNFELISWLKNIKEADSSTASNSGLFKEMKISAASNLSFTELQGVEYAFYDTDDKASLGYLRFKPLQKKPKKKAKRFHLHFVALMGNFRITANEEESRISVGDMVAIEKSVYYDIENLTEDIGILMVIKK